MSFITITVPTEFAEMLKAILAQMEGSGAVATKSKKVKRAPKLDEEGNVVKRVPSEKQTEWVQTIKDTQAEMLAANWAHPETGKKATYKDAMTEASRRRAEADPEVAKKQLETKEKKAAAKAKKAEKEDSDEEKSTASSTKSSKKEVKNPRTDEQKAKAAATRAANKALKAAAAVPLPAETAEEMEIIEDIEEADPRDVFVEKTVGKTKMFVNGHNHVRDSSSNEGKWLGVWNPATKKLNAKVPEPTDL